MLYGAESERGRALRQIAAKHNVPLKEVEAIANADVLRHTAEGRNEFIIWIVKLKGLKRGHELANELWPEGNGPAADAVTTECLRLWHEFFRQSRFASQELEPHPKSKAAAGGGKAEELDVLKISEISESLAGSFKWRNFDLHGVWKIAASELNQIVDTLDLLRSDPEYVLAAIDKRLLYMVDSGTRDAPARPNAKHRQAALVREISRRHREYMLWNGVLIAVQTLRRRGLTSFESIVSACLSDPKLAWDVYNIETHLRGLCQVVGSHLKFAMGSWSHFHSYVSFTRSKDADNIELSLAGRHHLRTTTSLFDVLALELIGTDNPIILFMHLIRDMELDPELRFTMPGYLFDIIGDMTAVCAAYAIMRRTMAALELSIFEKGPQARTWDRCNLLVDRPLAERVIETVQNDSFAMNILALHLAVAHMCVDSIRLNFYGGRDLTDTEWLSDPSQFQQLWEALDRQICVAAGKFDRGDGAFIIAFGFPIATQKKADNDVSDISSGMASVVLATPSVEADCLPVERDLSAPIATSRTGPVHSASSKDLEETHTPQKEQGRPIAQPDGDVQQVSPSANGGLSSTSNAKLGPPSPFKPGRKLVKVFHQILSDADNIDNGKKGKLRWQDFEKAMKKIGFSVVESAGSSVRFDPPGSEGLPITLHRPHPESELTPYVLRVLGRRLKSRYRWTMDDFVYDKDAVDHE